MSVAGGGGILWLELTYRSIRWTLLGAYVCLDRWVAVAHQLGCLNCLSVCRFASVCLPSLTLQLMTLLVVVLAWWRWIAGNDANSQTASSSPIGYWWLIAPLISDKAPAHRSFAARTGQVCLQQVDKGPSGEVPTHHGVGSVEGNLSLIEGTVRGWCDLNESLHKFICRLPRQLAPHQPSGKPSLPIANLRVVSLCT